LSPSLSISLSLSLNLSISQSLNLSIYLNIGGVTITIKGTNYCDATLDSCGIIIRIGTLNCELPYTFITSSEITCQLPSSTGLLLPVSVQVSSATSSLVNAPTITYSTAFITSISGCTSTITQLATIDCPNTLLLLNNNNTNTNNNNNNNTATATTIITINGYGFGPSSAIVLIDGQICSNVIHDTINPHNIIRCELPSGRGIRTAIGIIPLGGSLSLSDTSSVYLSYYQVSLLVC
jgi:hypothetical protein